jgi:hypothetical protein
MPPESDTAPSGVAELDIASAEAGVAEAQAGDAVSPRQALAAHDAAWTDEQTRRRGQLLIAIRKRIESRLAGRVRKLAVRIFGDTVVLEGECATYYTKQLAQHAALGILEDEHLENAIVVNVPRGAQ